MTNQWSCLVRLMGEAGVGVWVVLDYRAETKEEAKEAGEQWCEIYRNTSDWAGTVTLISVEPSGSFEGHPRDPMRLRGRKVLGQDE